MILLLFFTVWCCGLGIIVCVYCVKEYEDTHKHLNIQTPPFLSKSFLSNSREPLIEI